MLHANTETRTRGSHRIPSPWPPMPQRTAHARAAAPTEQPEAAVDEALAESFPASDPPAWNTGIARPGPSGGHGRSSVGSDRHESQGAPSADVIGVSRAKGQARRFVDALVTIAGAAGVALLVPFAILLVGLPIALALRGLVELAGWAVGIAAP